MAEMVNLRRVRKAAKRAQDEKDAAAQRLSHGTPKPLRQEIEARRKKAERDIDAHRIGRKE
jgi:hypothetical protein